MDEKRPASGLAVAPPGPELAALLAGVDPAAVANTDTVDILQAWSRQLAHTQAGFMAAMLEVARSTPFTHHPPGEQASVAASARRLLAAGEWAAAEVAAGLAWTHHSAERELGFAQDLIDTLPLVFAALSAGALDRAKAWVFVDVLGAAELTDPQRERICKATVARAAAWTTGQLRSRLLRMILAVDPGYTARRYRAAVRDRGVVGYLDPDGTAVVRGFGLSPAEANAACERLDGLAEQIVHAGHPGAVHQVRADLFTGLLDGRFEGLGSAQIIAAMLADAAEAGEVTDTADAAEATDTTEGEAAADIPATNVNNAAPTTAAADSDDSKADSPYLGSPSTRDQDTPDRRTPDQDAPDQELPDRGRVAARWGGEIRVGLATLLLRDDRPGEIPGWGPVLADIARLMAARQRGSEWRFAVTDPDGFLILAGITRRRPAIRSDRACRGGVVELHIPATLLRELATDPDACGEWAAVIADIARQYARRDQLTTALATRPNDRLAHAALRRHVQIRDRRCVAPGCRRPARRCELDHTFDYARGGLTLADNSGPLCLRHHLMKTEGGWRLEQPEPGRFHWISPLGRSYWTRGEPIDPPDPDPCPRPEDPDDLDGARSSGRRWDGPTMQRPPPLPAPPPRPPSKPPDDSEPPF